MGNGHSAPSCDFKFFQVFIAKEYTLANFIYFGISWLMYSFFRLFVDIFPESEKISDYFKFSYMALRMLYVEALSRRMFSN